jgi:RNA polymerase sigma factor (sigma-70 family)
MNPLHRPARTAAVSGASHAATPCGELTDASLLARVAAGDSSALALLYDRHAPGLLRFARRVDSQDAEDLLQTTFLRVSSLAARFDMTCASARPWLFAILMRVAQERSRALRRFSRALQRLAELPRTAASDPPDVARDLDRGLAQLSVAKRSVLLLAEVEGFSCDEIASMLQIPVGTVWTRLHHARRELRAWTAQVEP